ncbi:class II glutamine amidotransferase [Rhizobium sp. G21]|uniref:class II glutamine amidotransferase n=1 Tax=Rhizobium sp. G21 TaxID=2758439 RepID=UPI0016003700|nr:class II glutamine amidotransferase [Rhizobium sp. G21]MBB1249383.1 class II glutamine amidotransferase [Rhizobium sp. G21]
MCRWAAYRGEPLFLEDIVSAPAHSLVAQSLSATLAKTPTNGDGFGIAWYGDRDEPGLYRDVMPAWADCNLKSLARQIRSTLFLAHVRAATYGATRRDNCHPFAHGRWSFMHNGQIGQYDRMRRALESLLPDELYAARRGTTDSELIFMLALHFGLDAMPMTALREALALVERQALHMGITPDVRFTAAFSDGDTLYGVRYATGASAPTLYASRMGGGYCLVSEPLDEDERIWGEIPDGSAVVLSDDGIKITPFSTGVLTETSEDLKVPAE